MKKFVGYLYNVQLAPYVKTKNATDCIGRIHPLNTTNFDKINVGKIGKGIGVLSVVILTNLF